MDSSAKTFPVIVQPGGWAFTAPADATLLAAARAGGVVLASSCRNGTCRSCMARVVSGVVVHRIEWPGLSAEEKQEGWILPCVAEPRSALVIEARANAAPPVV